MLPFGSPQFTQSEASACSDRLKVGAGKLAAPMSERVADLDRTETESMPVGQPQQESPSVDVAVLRELVLELGCEELPAMAVRQAMDDLAKNITSRLAEANISHGEVQTYATPRRLIVGISSVVERQPDSEKEVRGPSVKVAFDAANAPTGALLGFCKSQGVDPNSVTNDGEYVWIRKRNEGQPTAELLTKILPDAICALTFPKSMRWGTAKMRFARPIRWILAVYDHAPVSFSIETVESGSSSVGHRFMSPTTFQAKTLAELLSGLRERFVEPDPILRERMIRDESRKIAPGMVEFDDMLVDENVFLTEWPMPVLGTFREEFMILPEPVLITAMAKHERTFPVRSGDGKLTQHFIAVRNSGHPDAVSEGYEWVLNARFNDAKFFYDEDRKRTFDEFLQRTEAMMFQEELGSVRLRCDRLAALARRIATDWIGETAGDQASMAGLYAKADLSTGLVSELSSLQGVIGGEYARQAGLPGPVADAIAGQYRLSSNLPADTLGEQLAVCVCVADQIDKLAGYLGVGLTPTGSSDPFGLRRAVNLVIEAGLPGSADRWFVYASEQYLAHSLPHNAESMRAALVPIFKGRYEVAFEEVRHDIVQAALADDLTTLANPTLIAGRVEALSQLAPVVEFVQAATRPINIVRAAEKKGIAIQRNGLAAVDVASLDSAEGVALRDAAMQAIPLGEDIDAALDSVRALQGPINAFFEATMVMVDDTKVRDARLSLLAEVSDLLLSYGDFTALVIEG